MCPEKKITLIVLFVTLFALFQSEVYAQVDEVYRVETTDGNVVMGVLVSEDSEQIILRVEALGEVTILRRNIRRITQIDADRIRNGVYWYENPQATRYFFAPNAIGLKKGKGYYQNTWIFFNNVNYGVSDNFSIGGGMVPMFLFGISSTPVWILPKVSFPVSEDKFHIGAGAMLGGLVGTESDLIGLFYGVGTLGNRDRNLSVGLGYGYGGGEVSTTPLINVSGMLRTGRRVYLLTENYFIPEAGVTGIVSFGVRWSNESLAVDFGLFSPLDEAGDIIGIPWLGVTIPFGR